MDSFPVRHNTLMQCMSSIYHPRGPGIRPTLAVVPGPEIPVRFGSFLFWIALNLAIILSPLTAPKSSTTPYTKMATGNKSFGVALAAHFTARNETARDTAPESVYHLWRLVICPYAFWTYTNVL